MVNLLNEEIRAIKHTISRKKQMQVLTTNAGYRNKLRKDIEELNKILEDKLEKAGDN